MSETTLDDVVERLAALEAAVKELTAAVGTSDGEKRPAPVATPAPAPQAAQAPTPQAPTPQAAAPAPTPRATPAPAPSRPAPRATPEPEPEPEADTGEAPPFLREHPLPRANEGFEAAIMRMFQYAMVEPKEDSDDLLAALTHPMQMRGPRSLDHLRAFNWTKLRRSLDRYIVDRDPSTFRVVRTDPVDAHGSDFARIFLDQAGGMPAPVHVRRDESSGGAWRVDQISL